VLAVLAFLISIVIGVAVAFSWTAVWALVLRVLGIPALGRTEEQRALRKHRICRMGKLRYIIVFGVFGSGFAFGLGFSVAGVAARVSSSWGQAAATFVSTSLVFGCLNGLRTWNENYRGPVPFPPHYPQLK